LKHENEGLREALLTKKKHKVKGKALNLQQRQEYRSRGVWWSPRKLEEGKTQKAILEREEMEEKLQKARKKKEKEDLHLQRQIQAEERRVERERLKVVREKEKADKAAERQRQKEERDSAKALQLSQRGKRKALQDSSSKNKRQKQRSSSRVIAEVQPKLSAQPPKVTSRSRNVNLPQKFR
jgi:hypothetical protein